MKYDTMNVMQYNIYNINRYEVRCDYMMSVLLHIYIYRLYDECALTYILTGTIYQKAKYSLYKIIHLI